MGHGYVLGCPEDGEVRLNQAVAKVDEAMCKIRDSGKIKARDRIAVLAALNLAFESPEKSAAVQTTTTPQQTDPSRDEAQLSALLQRLDMALGQDGQLL